MNDFDKKLDFDSNTFENMKHDMNFVLQRLLGNMIEKQSNEGSMTIKIDVTMVKEFSRTTTRISRESPGRLASRSSSTRSHLQ